MWGAWAARSSRPPLREAEQIRPSAAEVFEHGTSAPQPRGRTYEARSDDRGGTTVRSVPNQPNGPPLAPVAAQHQDEGIARHVGDGEEQRAVLLEAEGQRAEGAAHARWRIELEGAYGPRGW